MNANIEALRSRSAGQLARWALRKKYKHTDETDAVVRDAYRRFAEFNNRNAIPGAAKKLGWPRYAVTQRARKLGLSKTKESPWTDAEEKVLEDWGFLSLPRLAMKLRRFGFRRSETAIHLKMKRLKIKGNLDGWSMRSLSRALGVDDHAVALWIKRGMLKAQDTGITCGTNEKVFVKRKDVREFLLHHPEAVDHAKAEKYFLFDVLSDGQLCAEFRKEIAA